METELEVGKTYARNNSNGEKLSNVTINEGTLFYHIDLIKSGVNYDEVIVRRIHTAPGESKCESCEG